MVADLKPYPAYKDSGVAWLGDVPEHWELRRTKTLLSERSEKGCPNKPLLAATQFKGVVRKEHYANRTVLAMKDLHLLKVVHSGDFVISLRSFQGGIEYARDSGIISPAYTILYPAERSHHAYLSYLFKSKAYITNLSLFVTGIRQGQNIDYARLARSILALPPLPEQTAIVRFLGHATGQIDRYIRVKQKMIELLGEQKQVLVNDAVTGRVDVRTGQPYPAYKDSGVAWLGDVPRHWEVKRLKFSAHLNAGQSPSSEVVSEYPNGLPFLQGNAEFGPISPAPRLACDEAAKRAYAGDILLSIRAPVGAINIADQTYGIGRGLCAIQPSQGLEGRFAYYLLFSIRLGLHRIATGSTYDAVTASDVGNLPAILPPPPTEQTAIVEYLDKAIAAIAAAIDRTRRQIELMEEYRTRLISDVVTGKIDVREAAAELPERSEKAESTP